MRLVRAGMVAVLAVGTVTVTGGAAEARPHPAAAWDFNGDGFKDLVVGIPTYRFRADGDPAVGAIGVGYGSSAGPGELKIYTGPGSVNTGGLWQGYGRVLTSGDFDGDGYADLAVGGIDDAKGRGSIYLHWGGKSGLARTALRLWGPRRVDWSKFGFASAAGDFDHDGYSELFVSDVYGGHAWVYRGGKGFRKKHKPAALPVWDKKAYVRSAAAGDFNGDGRDDLVLSWFRRKDINTKTPDRLSVYAGTKKGLKAHATAKVPANTGLPAVGDLTGAPTSPWRPPRAGSWSGAAPRRASRGPPSHGRWPAPPVAWRSPEGCWPSAPRAPGRSPPMR